MASVGTKAWRAIGVCYTLLFSLLMSLLTLVLVDGAIAAFILAWRRLSNNFAAMARFQSAVLRSWFSLFMGHLELVGGMTLVLTGDALYANETALVVCNHRSWADTVTIYSLARQVRMHGAVKFLAKRSLLLFPLYGFAGWILDVVIFIKRQSDSAGRSMERVFSSLTDSRRGRAPYWLINYLEGTRFTLDKLRKAQEFARDRGLKPLDHLLQPRTKGFISTVHALRGSAEAVYDITIGYAEDADRNISPSFRDMYFVPSRSPRTIHVHQRRIPLSEIPDDEDELRDWIYKLYEQKDELLRGFYRTGKFEGRAMRWNRITWGYWANCYFITFGAFAFVSAMLMRIARV